MEMANALYFGAGALRMAFVWGWLHNLRVQAERMVRQSKTRYHLQDKLKEQLTEARLNHHKVRTERLQCDYEEQHLNVLIGMLKEEIAALDREIDEDAKKHVDGMLPSRPPEPGVHGYQPITKAPSTATQPPAIVP